MCFDSGYDLFHLASHFYLRTEKLFGFLHSFAGNDLAYLELHFSKLLEGDLRFCLDINDGLFFFFFFLNRRMKFFYFFHHFFQIQSLEQDFRLICYVSAI